MTRTLYVLVDRLYEEKLVNEKYELVFIIKSFMQMYHMFSLRTEEELDIDLLVRSMTDKLEVIATHSKVPFVTDDLLQLIQIEEKEVAAADLLARIETVIEEIEDDIVRESLQLLGDHVIEKNLERATVQGLLHNIQREPLCKEVSYLYRKFSQN